MGVDFGKTILFLRTKCKINQTDFGKRIGMTKSSISAYERGTKYPSHDVLVKISKEFGVSMDFLYGFSEYEQK